MSALAPVLESFFTDRLAQQRRASPHTVSAYRDTFRLLLGFVHKRLRKAPSDLDLQDLDAPMIGAFLEDLEKERHNSVRTRNARLAAIHSLFRYAALRAPNHAALIQRVLAIPNKRFERAPVAFLEPSEVEALLSAPDGQSWIDRRDHALLFVAVQTGLRVSELILLNRQDVQLGPGAHVRCQGKGRKEVRRGETVSVERERIEPVEVAAGRHHGRPARDEGPIDFGDAATEPLELPHQLFGRPHVEGRIVDEERLFLETRGHDEGVGKQVGLRREVTAETEQQACQVERTHGEDHAGLVAERPVQAPRPVAPGVDAPTREHGRRPVVDLLADLHSGRVRGGAREVAVEVVRHHRTAAVRVADEERYRRFPGHSLQAGYRERAGDGATETLPQKARGQSGTRFRM